MCPTRTVSRQRQTSCETILAIYIGACTNYLLETTRTLGSMRTS